MLSKYAFIGLKTAIFGPAGPAMGSKAPSNRDGQAGVPHSPLGATVSEKIGFLGKNLLSGALQRQIRKFPISPESVEIKR